MIEQSTQTRIRAIIAAAVLAVGSTFVTSAPVAAQPQAQGVLPLAPGNLFVTNSGFLGGGNDLVQRDLVYRFTVTRSGSTYGQPVTVVHTAPPGLTFISKTSTSGLACSQTASSAENRLICKGQMAAAGDTQQATFEVRYRRANPLFGGNYTMRTTVDPNHVIPETTEADNVASFTFSL